MTKHPNLDARLIKLGQEYRQAKQLYTEQVKDGLTWDQLTPYGDIQMAWVIKARACLPKNS